jgi:hypothetical protein
MSKQTGTRAVNSEAPSTDLDWHDWKLNGHSLHCALYTTTVLNDYSLLLYYEQRYEETDRFSSLILISFILSINTDALIVATHHVSDRFSAKRILDQPRGYSTTGTDQAVVP